MTAWINALLGWYRRHRRALPWREQPTPYRVWISEIMLQQTQVATVQPYFERFVGLFPSLAALAGADLQAVLKAWEGLGYYRRARNLQRAAMVAMSEHGGCLPGDLEGLRSLPGIGPYTAAAIASIAYGLPHPVVDGNVARVGARLWCIEADTRSAPVQRDLHQRLRLAIEESGDPSAFNQALMELGALVCRPREPHCDACPLQQACGALATGRTAELPRLRPTRRVPHYRVAVGLIEHEGRVLIARRDERQMLGGLWEFPGGKQEKGEKPAETVVREVREELHLGVRVTAKACTIQHAYSHFRITLTAFHCVPTEPAGTARCERPLAWVPWERLGDYPFPKANHKVLAALGRALPNPARGDAGQGD